MMRQAAVQAQQTTNHPLSQGGILQRKCTSCGQHKTGGGTCANCHSNGSKPSASALPMIQTKLTVGAPNDKYEQEADRVADQIMRMPAPVGQADTALRSQRPSIQRKCAQCDEEQRLQMKETLGGTPEVTPAIASRIQSLQGSGQPLPDSTRSFFEPRFGQNFSHVRVHTDSSAQALQARAYTTGKNIVFGAGQYSPDTNEGRRLLAHELTHVVQQQVGSSSTIRRQPTCENDPSTIPPGISCPIANSSPPGPALDVFFNIEDSALSANEVAALQNIVRNWRAAGGTDQIRVDGFASCDGPPSLNWRLSCDRALAAAHELIHPSDPTLVGIDPAFVEIFANGETNRFSPSLGPNRRATVTLTLTLTLTSPPPDLVKEGKIRWNNETPELVYVTAHGVTPRLIAADLYGNESLATHIWAVWDESEKGEPLPVTTELPIGKPVRIEYGQLRSLWRQIYDFSTTIIDRDTWGARPPIVDDPDRSYEPYTGNLEEIYDSITIHHAGNEGYRTINEVQNFHMDDKDRADVSYHYGVSRWGTISEGRNIAVKGAHVEGGNTGKIGIVLLADLNEQLWDFDDEVTEDMETALLQLIHYLIGRFPRIRFLGGHKEYTTARDCPGNLGMARMNNWRSQTGLRAPSPVN